MKSLADKRHGFGRFMRNRSIFSKILSGYLLLAVALVVMTIITSYLVMRHTMIRANKADLQEKARIVADIFTEEGRGDPAYVRMRNIENLTEAQVIYVGQDMVARQIPRRSDRIGQLSPEEEVEQALQLSGIIDALDVQLVTSILGGGAACDVRTVEFMGGEVLFAGAPVYDGNQNVAGAAIIYLPFDDVQGLADDLVWMIVLSCAVAGLLSTVLAFAVSRWLVRPIGVLTSAARRMSAGHYGEKVPLDQSDELGELGGALSHLSERLKTVISDLRDEKSKLMQILAGIGEGIVAVDRDGRVVHCNNAALELLELSAWDGPADSAGIQHRGQLMEMLYQAMSTGERTEAVWRNGTERSIAARVWPMTGEVGQSIGAVGLLRDVSEAERLEQMRRDYVANISHELRTPLTGIRGMVEPLLDGYMETEEEKMDCYRIIYQETMRLEKLIGEMLDLSRLQAGRAQVELEPMCAASLMEAACMRMRERAQKSGVELSVCLPETPLPQVMGNENRILQVLIILMDNAFSFTPAGGSVTLTARAQGKSVYLGVRDTGAGIDPADLPYIWERFYKADKSRMRTTGTGLGLAIAKLVVECMGGRIGVESEVGKGSAFEFSLMSAEE